MISLESKVNVYGQHFSKVFRSASGSFICDVDGFRYFDLFSSAGVCNFGHNHPQLKEKLVAYIQNDGLVHGLDYYTESKIRFIELMENKILPEREKGQYHYYFSPPTGTLAIEAAIKYARKYTGRRELACFTNGFHGLSYNALSITGNASKRRSSYCDLQSAIRLPYEGYNGSDFDYLALYRRMFEDISGGSGVPAAVVFETIQAEGGCHTASASWYEGLLKICRDFGIVSIVDEIQAGCGRTGDYFSFGNLSESWPDIICMSKSLSGLGLPLSLVMMRAELDVLDSGENSGTFRGNCLGTASAANTIELFVDSTFQNNLRLNQAVLACFASVIRDDLKLEVKGRGMIRGVVFPSSHIAQQVVSQLRHFKILVETCGGSHQTVKIMPPLVSCPKVLDNTLSTVVDVIRGLTATL